MALSPMMQQYMKTKEQYSDCILFYRLGDFYEMFFDDAITVSRELELVLTGKACGEDERAPMCGIPYHAVESYLSRLIEKGYKVAIAEQMTDPATTKGLVEREVIRVVTPGTVISSSILSEKENNYLLSVYFSDYTEAAWCDVSTGEFCAARFSGFQELSDLIARIQPKEIITNQDREHVPQLWDYATGSEKLFISCISPRLHYDSDAPSMLVAYLKDTQKQDISHLEPLKILSSGGIMRLDRATIRNLEITETLFERKTEGSLLGVLDCCKTAMGSRRMKQWLREPLTEVDAIQQRLDAVESLSVNILQRNNIREALKQVYDLERLAGRISLGTANARDLLALKTSFFALPDIKSELSSLCSGLLNELDSQIECFTAVRDIIDAAITEEPPFTIREGGIIKRGYSEELDNINDSAADCRQWIASLEATEKERTGIKNLKVGFNKVFGYYIEISKSQLSMAPDNYIRKQTLVGGERFITPELKEAENTVLNAQTKINDLEYRIFCDIKQKVMELIPKIQITASALAVLDVLCSFAHISEKMGYVKPEINGTDVITIQKGRHPVIESTIEDGVFVSNDLYMDRSRASMLLITGPNMAGKSTYMRQLALIVLMAQSGCFVPAQKASIGICDRIYTRIGASDNLAMGQSTFFVEMTELSYILNTASEKSLIILDEIGRGTSTYDGLSIAWAVVEDLTRKNHRIRTLFATHYHELTVLESKIKGVKNLNVDVVDSNGNIIFLHKIIEGSASRSYGIHVARLAGVPDSVLEAAERKLNELEAGPGQEASPQDSKSSSASNYNSEGKAFKVSEPEKAEPQQMSLFNFTDSVLAARIRNLDLMNITPSQAIAILEELKEAALK